MRKDEQRTIIFFLIAVYVIVALFQTCLIINIKPTAKSTAFVNLTVLQLPQYQPINLVQAAPNLDAVFGRVEPGLLVIVVRSALAGTFADFNTSVSFDFLQSLGINFSKQVRNGIIAITELSSEYIEGEDLFGLISRHDTVTSTPVEAYSPITDASLFDMYEISIPKSSYKPKLGELIYRSFNVVYIGFVDKITDVTFKLKVNSSWVENNSVNPHSFILYRQAEPDGNWTPLPMELTRSNEEYYYYTAVSPGLSTFVIVGTSPPLLCSICETGKWSDCTDGKQTRLTTECGSQTGYTCRPVVEERPCEVPLLPTAPGLSLDIIIIPVIGLAVGSYLLVGGKKKRKEQELEQ